MDSNTTAGKNWPKLDPHEQLEILRRYRDNNLQSKEFDRQYNADDFFIKAVLDNELQDQYMEEIVLDNRT